MRPSSSVITTPNSSGFSTDFRASVARPPRSRWNATSAPRSMSQSASPEITTNVSSRSSAAFLTDPAVPSGLSSTEYSSRTPSDEPFPR